MKEIGQVAEGIRTTKAAYQLIQNLQVEAPIITQVYKTLYEGKDLKEAIESLLERAPEKEFSF